MDAGSHRDKSFKVIIFGLGRFGTAVGMRLQKRGIRVLGVDFNPLPVRRWRELGLEAEFGDATDPEFVADIPFKGADWMVSTLPVHPTDLSHEDTRTTLIQMARSAGFSGRIAAASFSVWDTELLYGAGTDMILEPHQDAADRTVELLCGAEEEERTEIPEIANEDPIAQ